MNKVDNKASIQRFFESAGWTKDGWGHYHKGNRRVKMQARSFRLEKKAVVEASKYSPRQSFWVKLYSAYYSNVEVRDGKVVEVNNEKKD